MASGAMMDWGQGRLMLRRQVGGSNLKWTGPGRVGIPRRNPLGRLIRSFPPIMSENLSGSEAAVIVRNVLQVRCQGGFTALESSTHHEKLRVALDVVQRACQLCLSVRAGIKKGEWQLDKNDHSPVTIADFGVQALVSLELGRLFPGIPMIGEEDAGQLRTDYEKSIASGNGSNALIESIVTVLAAVSSPENGNLDCEFVLEAIDRGGKDISTVTGDHPGHSTYWVLDPIDGTRGFLRGGDALYVVGLALVEDGKPVLGIMGCPNLAFQYSLDSPSIKMATTYFETEEIRSHETRQRGLIMAASMGGGCWVMPFTESLDQSGMMMKSEVDNPYLVADAWFCISDNEVWSTLPLARALASGSEEIHLPEENAQVLSLCCGSLCKYLALAIGGVSAFVLHAKNTTPLKVWDHAAGVICVVEAGGQVSDLEGTALENLIGNGRETFTVKGGGILASNNALHSLLLTRVRKQASNFGT